VNHFEADAVASPLLLLEGSLADKPDYERQPDGSIGAIGSNIPHTGQGFWERAVGVIKEALTTKLRLDYPDQQTEIQHYLVVHLQTLYVGLAAIFVISYFRQRVFLL
jgi:hypothetical protein